LKRSAMSLQAVGDRLNQFSQTFCGPGSFSQFSKFGSGSGMKRFVVTHLPSLNASIVIIFR
jgi:hypothetical protein